MSQKVEELRAKIEAMAPGKRKFSLFLLDTFLDPRTELAVRILEKYFFLLFGLLFLSGFIFAGFSMPGSVTMKLFISFYSLMYSLIWFYAGKWFHHPE